MSVVVPCYNGGRFLPALATTLEAQTFRDFEVLLVDDGSTDQATLEAIERLPSFIKVLRQENRGLPSARNTGFEAARGHYVLPLDCDDGLHASFLQRAVAALDEGDGRRFAFADMQTTGKFSAVLPRRYNRFDQLFINRLPYCLLVPRSAWLDAGGYDAGFTSGYEDWEFNIRLSKIGYHGVRLPEPLFHYRVDTGGMLLAKSARQHGRLWHRIMTKHAELYTRPALASAFAAARADDEPSRFGLALGMSMAAAARVLPTSFIDRGFYLALRMAIGMKERAG